MGGGRWKVCVCEEIWDVVDVDVCLVVLLVLCDVNENFDAVLYFVWLC